MMKFFSWCSNLTRRRVPGHSRPAGSVARNRCLPRMEVLEERALLHCTSADPDVCKPISHTGLGMHIHPNLSIFVDGQKREVPADLGIENGQMLPLHTHDTSGSLHVEFPTVKEFKLKNFFTDIWHQPFSATELMEARGTSIMFVDNKPNTQFGELILKDNQSIVVRMTSAPVQPPPPATTLAIAVDVAEVSEAAGTRAVLATVSRRGSTTAALVVTLTSSRTGDVPSPGQVTIPAGAERVTTFLDLLDNAQADGTRTVTLTATATDITPATTTFNVLDNEAVRGLYLSQATYTGNEGAGTVRVTVVRGSQDVNVNASVGYFTSDGTAKAGTDYTATTGTLTLAAGELSKSFTVALADDAAAKAGRKFTVSLFNPQGLALVSPTLATVAISDNDLPAVANSEWTNKLSGASDGFAHSRELYNNFVNGAYQKYLKRGPDTLGLNGWVDGMLARQVTDESLEAGFLASAEYIAKNGGKGRGWIVGMYNDLLGRGPVESEIQAWLQRLAGGVTEYQVAYGFAASAEREGQRVRANYQTYLQRGPSQAEVDAYVAEFVSGKLTNEDVIARFIGSPEYYGSAQRGQGNLATWVAVVYEQVLFRNPSRAEVEAWVNKLR